MKIAVLGTGRVGHALASKLVAVGHEVMMGSREAGNPKERNGRLRRVRQLARDPSPRRRPWPRSWSTQPRHSLARGVG
ncbi:NAD(P)-binding domain-containing protein [Arthrobacter sp. FW306-04-A]|uniref:NAD(P)-binding domain-containing protein n=1 Tax=Arthrobacter sp. FW306-04-A TaxID=2879619 RepID=UPI0037BE77D5